MRVFNTEFRSIIWHNNINIIIISIIIIIIIIIIITIISIIIIISSINIIHWFYEINLFKVLITHITL